MWIQAFVRQGRMDVQAIFNFVHSSRDASLKSEDLSYLSMTAKYWLRSAQKDMYIKRAPKISCRLCSCSHIRLVPWMVCPGMSEYKVDPCCAPHCMLPHAQQSSTSCRYDAAAERRQERGYPTQNLDRLPTVNKLSRHVILRGLWTNKFAISSTLVTFPVYFC